MTERMTDRMGAGHSATESSTQGAQDNRRHFLVDINTVFRLFGKNYFLIFYFGRHLHPRQQARLVNQRTAGNWLVLTIALLLLAGFIYGAVQLVSWRLSNGAEMPSGAGSFTQRAIEPASAVARL